MTQVLELGNEIGYDDCVEHQAAVNELQPEQSGEPMSWHLLLTCCVERHIEMEPGYLICILITVTYFKGYFTNYCAGLNDCEPQPLFPISEKPKNLDAEMVSILICWRDWL